MEHGFEGESDSPVVCSRIDDEPRGSFDYVKSGTWFGNLLRRSLTVHRPILQIAMKRGIGCDDHSDAAFDRTA